MSETTIDLFRQTFPTLMNLIDESESYHLEITLPHELIGVGASATAIIKHRNGRGFGMTWQIDRGQLHGLKSRRFDASEPDDSPANVEWIRELERRLSLDGESRSEIARALRISGNHFSHKAKMRQHLARRAY